MRQHPRSFQNWEILETYATKSEAQKAETLLAELLNCTSEPGGDGSERDTWYVYYFEY